MADQAGEVVAGVGVVAVVGQVVGAVVVAAAGHHGGRCLGEVAAAGGCDARVTDAGGEDAGLGGD